MNPELKKTIVVFHISAVLYFLMGFAALIALVFSLINFISDAGLESLFFLFYSLILLAIGVGFGVFVEIVVKGLKRGKFWAWVAGIAISGLYIPSLFIVLGIIGLLGLLNENTMKVFVKK
ncbi:hypothetical protein J4209_03665 [Candidatus Woesearchaeota archaeon]|nr:hypothetical protein [Candidatus Woesearchaeota archaeon]